jgi:metal-responsive CopG/Arc/MetJ family transcriptional regulator
MSYITARLADQLILELDRVANETRRTRSDLVREALERYLESIREVRQALEQNEGREDRVVDWETIRRQIAG